MEPPAKRGLVLVDLCSLGFFSWGTQHCCFLEGLENELVPPAEIHTTQWTGTTLSSLHPQSLTYSPVAPEK